MADIVLPDVLANLSARIKADPLFLKDKVAYQEVAQLYTDNLVAFGQVMRSAELGKDHIKDLKDQIKNDIKVQEHQTGKIPKPEPIRITDPEILRKALIIAEHGDPMKYFIFNAQRQHLGDIHCQKIMLLSVCSANSLTSSGIQPGFTGDSGSGKDDATMSIYTMVPDEYRFEGILTEKTLLYCPHLKPGMIIYSADVEYKTIVPIFKVSAGHFQVQTIQHTVSIEREYDEHIMPERQVFILTSVESVDNKEASNRQWPISTDAKEGHKKTVSTEISKRRARPELRFIEDEGTTIGKAIFQDIYDNGPFKVLIPQADNAEWLLPAQFRGQNQFWDLVDAFAILRWRQRDMNEDGWLLANDQDINDAIELMLCFKSGHVLDLTPAEIELVKTMSSGGKFTQAQIAETLKIGQPTVSARLKSIMGKTAIVLEYGDYNKTYGLTPDGIKALMNTEVGLINIKDLKSDTGEIIAPLSHCYRYIIGIPIGITINISNRIPITLLVYRGPECGKNNSCTLNLHDQSCKNCELEKYLFFPTGTTIIPIIDQNQQAAA